MSDNTNSMDKPNNGAGGYAGLIGLGDSNRLDSDLYEEQVDFDFFETGNSQEPQMSKVLPVDTLCGVDSSSSSTGGGGLTVVVQPPTPAEGPKNNFLLLQITPNQTATELVISPTTAGTPVTPDTAKAIDGVPFSTQLLMAALQDTDPQSDLTAAVGLDSNLNDDHERQSAVRVHLFDLTDSDEDDDDGEELELAEINGHAEAAVMGTGNGLHSWDTHDFYHRQHMQQQEQNQREQAHRQKKRHRVHVLATSQGQVGVLSHKSVSDDDEVHKESSDDDDEEEGYYLSDSERSDITDVTPMSSVACSPMPPFTGNANGAPFSRPGVPSESDDSYDGYPINHIHDEEGDDECLDDIDDEELGRITPSEDDDDIDEILRILPSSATGQNFEIPTDGVNVDPFMKMYRDGPNSPAAGGEEHDYNRQYTLNAVAASAGLDRHYYTVTEAETHEHDLTSGGGGGNENIGSRAGNGNNLLTVNYGNAGKNYVDAQRRRMLAAAHAHHSTRHGHHVAHTNGAGPKLNKVHHPTTNGHGHHHHHAHHGPGSYFYGHGHGGHHFNHSHGHGHAAHHHNNYHQQYHNLTMALQRKRVSQQKQIDHDNSILKRKIQNVKPSLDIMKAFGQVTATGAPISTHTHHHSSTSSSSGTPAPGNKNAPPLESPGCDCGSSSTGSNTPSTPASSSSISASGSVSISSSSGSGSAGPN